MVTNEDRVYWTKTILMIEMNLAYTIIRATLTRFILMLALLFSTSLKKKFVNRSCDCSLMQILYPTYNMT